MVVLLTVVGVTLLVAVLTGSAVAITLQVLSDIAVVAYGYFLSQAARAAALRSHRRAAGAEGSAGSQGSGSQKASPQKAGSDRTNLDGGGPRHRGNGWRGGEHRDSEHRDSEHRDSEHRDSEHRDSEHRDSEHRDSEHRDSEHRSGGQCLPGPGLDLRAFAPEWQEVDDSDELDYVPMHARSGRGCRDRAPDEAHRDCVYGDFDSYADLALVEAN
jgi:hypothetical protein